MGTGSAVISGLPPRNTNPRSALVSRMTYPSMVHRTSSARPADSGSELLSKTATASPRSDSDPLSGGSSTATASKYPPGPPQTAAHPAGAQHDAVAGTKARRGDGHTVGYRPVALPVSVRKNPSRHGRYRRGSATPGDGSTVRSRSAPRPSVNGRWSSVTMRRIPPFSMISLALVGCAFSIICLHLEGGFGPVRDVSICDPWLPHSPLSP